MHCVAVVVKRGRRIASSIFVAVRTTDTPASEFCSISTTLPALHVVVAVMIAVVRTVSTMRLALKCNTKPSILSERQQIVNKQIDKSQSCIPENRERAHILGTYKITGHGDGIAAADGYFAHCVCLVVG